MATLGIVPAGVAVASSPATTTIQLVAKQTATRFTSSSFQTSETDTQAGKLVGYDVLSCQPESAGAFNCGVGLSLSKGMIFGQFVSSASGNDSGRVSGGTGAYKGATGTIAGHAISSTAEAVTITLT